MRAVIADRPLVSVRPYTLALHCRPAVEGGCKWAATGRYARLPDELSQFGGTYPDATINQGYLQAAAELLGKFRRDSRLTIVSTHDYLIKAMAARRYEWWDANGWIMTDGLPVKNAALWQNLAGAAQRHAKVSWVRPYAVEHRNLLEAAAELSR